LLREHRTLGLGLLVDSQHNATSVIPVKAFPMVCEYKQTAGLSEFPYALASDRKCRSDVICGWLRAVSNDDAHEAKVPAIVRYAWQ
jgi:hypothetical protein